MRFAGWFVVESQLVVHYCSVVVAVVVVEQLGYWQRWQLRWMLVFVPSGLLWLQMKIQIDSP